MSGSSVASQSCDGTICACPHTCSFLEPKPEGVFDTRRQSRPQSHGVLLGSNGDFLSRQEVTFDLRQPAAGRRGTGSPPPSLALRARVQTGASASVCAHQRMCPLARSLSKHKPASVRSWRKRNRPLPPACAEARIRSDVTEVKVQLGLFSPWLPVGPLRLARCLQSTLKNGIAVGICWSFQL